MISLIKKHLNKDDGLLKSGGIFLIGSLLTAVLNYLYHLSMGRMLGPKEYGVLGSLFAIIYLIMFSAQTFNLVVSKYTAEFHGKNQTGYLKRLVKRAFFKSLLIGAIGFIGYLLISPLIAGFMNIDNISSVIIVGLIAYLSLVSAILIGALNGLQKFIWQNFSSFLSVFLKLTLAIVFVYIGFGVNGALTAILIGFIVSIFISAYPLKNILKNFKSEKFDSKKIYLYTIPVFFATLFPILLITFDQILVKHFFSSAEAGYYAAAGMIAKIIWFGSGFFIWVLFPKIVNLFAQEKDSSKLLIKCIIYTSILAILGISAYFIMPSFIVNVFYGSEYITITPMIGIFGLAMGLFSLIQVLITYNLAVEKYKFMWIIVVGFVIEVLGIYLFHNTILEIIKIFFGVNLFILIAMLVYNKKELGVSFVQ